MKYSQPHSAAAGTRLVEDVAQYDVIIIGAGVTGLYALSEELLQEWDWKEHYSGQPENERYLNYVADKFDLRRDIRLNSRVISAVYDEREQCWQVHTEDDHRARAQFVIAAVGVLSAHYV